MRKSLTGQVNSTKPKWIKVTNSYHLLPPRKSASDQGECLQEGHLSQRQGTWEAPRRETITRVVGGHEAEWGEAYRERAGQENSRRPATDYAKKPLVCHLPFNRSTSTARGDLDEQKPHHRPLRSQLCSGVLEAVHSQ